MNIARAILNSGILELARKKKGQPDIVDGPSVSQYEHDVNREKWGSKTEFLLSLLGYAVGIGNVCRFPYLCYRSGGGAFLVPYLVWLFLCGIPTFFLEICIGQFSSSGCTGMFRLMPLFKGAGIAIIMVNLITACYYSVMISYPLRFLVTLCFYKVLPWESCENDWNTPNCTYIDQAQNISSEHALLTPANEYFHNEILHVSKGIEEFGSVIWPLVGCFTFTWIVVYICVSRGIHSVGKVVYFTATFPYVILLILFFRSVTLPGASTGIMYYITPQWKKLKDMKVWADAAIQIFFSLGPGWGGLVNMASFNRFHNNAAVDAFLIPIVNCGTSIFAGFIVFGIIGFLSHKSGIDVSNVAVDGPTLAFITYPEAIALVPVPRLWGILFFVMLFILGLDSVFVQIEAIAGSLLDEFPSIRKLKIVVSVVLCLVILLGTIVMSCNNGIFILTLLDWYTASIAIILVCVLEVYMVSWNYGIDRFMLDMQFMLRRKLNPIWKYLWSYVSLFFLIFVFITSIAFNRRVTYNKIEYPDWAVAMGWTVCFTSVGCVPGYMLYIFIFKRGSCKGKWKAYTNITDWGPADPDTKQEYLMFIEDALEQERELARMKREEKARLKAEKQQQKEDKKKEKENAKNETKEPTSPEPKHSRDKKKRKDPKAKKQKKESA